MKSPFKSDPWIGRSIGDRQRYRLDKRIGMGGMGDVFLAMDTLLGQQVALKLLKDTLVTSVELRKRFEREVAVSAALKSDHIVQVSDYGVSAEGYPFYVMEYLRGQSLGQLLRREGRLSVERTVSIITQVCDGLREAHQGVTMWRNNATASEHIKVVHRDLKPDNIFLVSTVLGELVKILDFGIAKIRQDAAEHTNLTNMFLGTFQYAAPEQLEVATDIDERADIYSLGIILYEMLCSTDPFGLGLNTRKISGISWATAHTYKPPQPLRSQPGLSQLQPELETVVMRCLQKAPDERFASVNELKQALQAAIAVEQRAIAQPPTALPSSENQTIVRPLTPPRSEIPTSKIAQTSPPRQGIPDGTIAQTSPPRQGIPDGTIAQTSPPRQGIPDGTIVQSSPPRQGIPDGTIAQSSPPRQGIPDGTIVQSSPPRQGIPDGTIAQSSPPRQGIPDGTIAQSSPPRQGIPDGTIVQSSPPRQGIPDGTIVQSSPPRQGIPDGTIAQSRTPSRQASRSLLTQFLLPLGIGAVIVLAILGAIFTYIQLHPHQKTNPNNNKLGMVNFI